MVGNQIQISIIKGKYSNNSEYYSMLKEYYQGIMMENEK
jgi:hypothetical protein